MPVGPDIRRRLRGALQRFSGGRVVWRGPAGARRVALTFDDGPDDLTPRYLEVLERHRAAATFFIMGDLVEERPGAVAAYLAGGHQVGGHGYDHQRFTTLSWAELTAQLDRTAAAIGPVPTGPLWVRPPYGGLDARAAAALLGRGHPVGMWSLDSLDYDLTDPDQIVARCRPDQLGPGEVLLFHEGHDATLAALPRIIDGLHDAGYELVTMADLFAE